tara:strand:- start:50 stop:1084 length:1035 start_codon:yes stop_codon:yes gene_type:complete
MSPFKSIKGRALGKLLEGYKSSDIGKGFGGAGDSKITLATGGTKTQYTQGTKVWTVHEFTSTGTSTFDVLGGSSEDVRVLVVGGGGGGGGGCPGGAGGGGGGAVIHRDDVPFSPGTYNVIIGTGGSGQPNTGNTPGAFGGDTTLYYKDGNFLALGGGGGHSNSYDGSTQVGSSGGGTGGYGGDVNLKRGVDRGLVASGVDDISPPTGFGGAGGQGTPGQHYRSGGGGGAGGNGANHGTSHGTPDSSGHGGASFQTYIKGPANPIHVGAGGGGGYGREGNGFNDTGGNGGTGAGHGGNSPQQTPPAGSNATGYGSGGGGHGYHAPGGCGTSGNGYQGIVIISYST